MVCVCVCVCGLLTYGVPPIDDSSNLKGTSYVASAPHLGWELSAGRMGEGRVLGGVGSEHDDVGLDYAINRIACRSRKSGNHDKALKQHSVRCRTIAGSTRTRTW